MKHYTAVVVDDNAHFCDTLLEHLCLSHFDAVGYDEAEKLLFDMFQSSLTPAQHPDLIVIDVKLKADKMQGLKLFEELAARNITSEVIAMSNDDPIAKIEAAMRLGAAEIVPKPPIGSFPELLAQMERSAKIGMKRRRSRIANGRHGRLDPNRRSRPVFISYSHTDKMFAAGIRRTIEARDIGVWYDITSLNLGDHIMQEIQRGIEQSIIFVALITDHYVESASCMDELDKFLKREQSSAPGELLFLPILDNLSYRNRSGSKLAPVISEYHCADVSVSSEFVEKMSKLLSTVRDKAMAARTRAMSA